MTVLGSIFHTLPFLISDVDHALIVAGGRRRGRAVRDRVDPQPLPASADARLARVRRRRRADQPRDRRRRSASPRRAACGRTPAAAPSSCSGISSSCSPSRRSRRCCATISTWAGFGRAMLMLALVWWAWSAYVWVMNAHDPESPAVRVALLLAAGLIFIAGLALPQAFHGEGMLFAVTYVCVRLAHLAPLRRRRRGAAGAAWSAIAGFGVTVLIGMGLLLAGSLRARRPARRAVDRRGGDRLRRARLADARAAARAAAGRRRALRRALRPVHHHLPRRVRRRDRRGRAGPAPRRVAARRGRADARDHRRAVVGVLHALRGGRRRRASRAPATRCSRRPTATATCTCCSSPA